MARKTSLVDDLFDYLFKLLEMFFELTGVFWQVGIILSFVFFGVGLYTFIDAINYVPPETGLLVILSEYAWLRYVIPTGLILCSFIFGIKAVSTYERQNY